MVQLDGTGVVRADLAHCLKALAIVPGPSGHATIRGAVCAPPSLVGPPGRLHGGLHAAVRLLAPYERIAGHEVLASRPLSLDLRMRRAISLENEVPFEGSLATTDDGQEELRTRFDGSDRLDGTLRTLREDGAEPTLAHFRALLAEDARTPEVRRFVGGGNLDVHVGERLLSMTLDEAFWARPGIDFERYLGPGRTIDPVFTSVVLDVAGAYVVGFELDARLFTTRLAIVVHGTTEVRGRVFRLLGDRQTTDVAGSDIAKVDVRGQLVGERRAAVLLADEALERAYGYGYVSLVPQRRA